MRVLGCTFLLLCSAFVAMSQTETPPALHLPANIVAGEAVAVPSGGAVSRTFYLIGPGHVSKRKIQAGDNIQIASDEIASAGTYQAIICNGEACASTSFYVAPNHGNELVFLVHPSRVAVGEPNAISAVTVVVDHMAGIPGRDGVTSPAYAALRRFIDGGKAWVKLSGPDSGSQSGPPGYGFREPSFSKGESPDEPDSDDPRGEV
jgi:hypothetical protein